MQFDHDELALIAQALTDGKALDMPPGMVVVVDRFVNYTQLMAESNRILAVVKSICDLTEFRATEQGLCDDLMDLASDLESVSDNLIERAEQC